MFKFAEWKRQLLRNKVTSEVAHEKFEFEWRLKNVEEFLKLQEEIQSPIFVGGPKSLHQWRLVISKRVRENEKQFFFGLELVKFGAEWTKVERGINLSEFGSTSSFDSIASASFSSGVKAEFKIISMGKKGETTIAEVTVGKEFKEGSKLGASISPAILRSSDNLDNGKDLRLRCEIRFEGQIKHGLATNAKEGTAEFMSFDSLLQHFDQRARDWKSVLESSVHSDVSIVTKTKAFSAHKVVLSAHSAVFGAMFHSKMAESIQNTVEIKDFDEKIVDLMLQYIYCGILILLKELEENAMDLFRIADKYEISKLKDVCELIILANLSVENSMDILILAHFHSPTSLKQKLAPFLKANRREIQRAESFKKACKTHPAVIADFNILALD